jgi:type III secretion protein N (ATPase)
MLSYLTDMLARDLDHARPLSVRGRVVEVTGTLIKAAVPAARIGEICLLRNPGESWTVQTEVVGFSKRAALLTPLGRITGISTAAEVIPTGRVHEVPVGPGLLGRVLDGLGRPLDEDRCGPLLNEARYPIFGEPPDPLTRRLISEPISLGVRALDGLLTCGEGQRLGIFAAAGGGKSTLLAMLAKGADVDVIVLALIGERGREVREFLDHELGPEGLARSVVVVATSDKPSMERLKAGYVATTIAEYFRDQGKRVLLMMDSVTRFARAQREIGLAAGEPPTRRGFPPSVFTMLPLLMERAGHAAKGSITALYTVLVEGDDLTEPVADETRSILDGHIVLSRKLAAANHYPAIDVLASASRVMNGITSSEHQAAAGKLRSLLAKYQEIELLVQIGEYRAGGDALADDARARIDAINGFLRQRTDEFTPFEDAVDQLTRVVGP